MSLHLLGKVDTHCYGERPLIDYGNIITVNILFVQCRADEGLGNSSRNFQMRSFQRNRELLPSQPLKWREHV